jgi:site-specific DNA-methyltransferase (adenine-specific)
MISRARYTRILLLSRARSSYHVFHGDSTTAQSYSLSGFGGKQVADILITDPPYCLLTRRRRFGDLRDIGRRKRKLDGQDTIPRFESVRDYEDFTRRWMTLCVDKALNPNASMIIWTNFLGKKAITNVANSLGFSAMEKEYLWCKHSESTRYPGKLTSSECLLRVYEVALIFHRIDSPLPLHSVSELTWSVVTDYHPTSVLASNQHPCHKPQEALLPLIKSWYCSFMNYPTIIAPSRRAL